MNRTSRVIQSLCILVLAFANFMSLRTIQQQRKLIEEYHWQVAKSLALANSCIGPQTRASNDNGCSIGGSRCTLLTLPASSSVRQYPSAR